METIRVLIADDQTITRSGIRSLLAAQEDVEIVDEAQNGEEAIEFASSTQPDVILMDLRMPGVIGIDTTRRIHRTFPHLGILVLTVFEDDTSVFPAIRAGARGYLLKNAEQDELLRAIHAVANGGGDFQPWDRTESFGLSSHSIAKCTRTALRRAHFPGARDPRVNCLGEDKRRDCLPFES